ncbi:hypothetical protein [Deinococcus irradiatisoli]|nr:hypothetical protein [Deinococcus irradiatisoli]
MTGTLAISLLSSLTLFLGLTALARQRIRREAWSLSGVLLSLMGVGGLGWLVLLDNTHFAAPAALIGLLGYCFGHFTTQRPAESRGRPSEEQPS